MKEAAGEANMTVITIILIAIVLAVGTVIVNNMMQNTKKQTACNSCGGTMVKGNCMVNGAQLTQEELDQCSS